MSSRGRKVTKDTKNIKAEKVVDKKAVEKQSAEQKTSAKQALDKEALDKKLLDKQTSEKKSRNNETSEKKPSPSPKTPNARGSLWLKLWLTLIVVAGLAAAGWFGWLLRIFDRKGMVFVFSK